MKDFLAWVGGIVLVAGLAGGLWYVYYAVSQWQVKCDEEQVKCDEEKVAALNEAEPYLYVERDAQIVEGSHSNPPLYLLHYSVREKKEVRCMYVRSNFIPKKGDWVWVKAFRREGRIGSYYYRLAKPSWMPGPDQ